MRRTDTKLEEVVSVQDLEMWGEGVVPQHHGATLRLGVGEGQLQVMDILRVYMNRIKGSEWFDEGCNITNIHLGFTDEDELGKEPLSKFKKCKIVIFEASMCNGTADENGESIRNNKKDY